MHRVVVVREQRLKRGADRPSDFEVEAALRGALRDVVRDESGAATQAWGALEAGEISPR